MRNDLAKVTTERPRHHRSYARMFPTKYGGKVRVHHDPEHEYEEEFGGFRSSARKCPDHHGEHKQFSDLLNALYGSLRKNVGRPWDDVYSEFCCFLDRRSLSGIHIFSHLMQEVTTKGLYEGADGVVYEYRAGIYWNRGYYDHDTRKWVEISNPTYELVHDTPVRGFYVHPVTGILCESKDERINPWASRREKKPVPIDYIKIDDSSYYARELCGRRPRSRFYAWFYYRKETTVRTFWARIGGDRIAKNAHFEGVEVAPYVSENQERYYKAFPHKYVKKADGFWYVLQSETKTKSFKRSANRADMKIIRDCLSKNKTKVA